MSANEIFARLRGLIEESDRSILYLATHSKVPHHRLYRFWVDDRPLSIEDTDKLFVFLTGKSIIAVPQEDDL